LTQGCGYAELLERRIGRGQAFILSWSASMTVHLLGV
jgi:hypothetical protein